MATSNNLNPLSLLVSSVVLIGLLFGGFLTIENRYLKAEDAYQKFQKIDKSLDRIYVHQLKQEAREILKDAKFRIITTHEQRRLQDITEELKKLGSTWTIPKVDKGN